MRQLILWMQMIFLMSSCNSTESQTNHTQKTTRVQETAASGTQVFKAKGLVKSIPPNRKQIIIDHEEIPGFMMAMTMPFEVSDSSMIQSIKPGDSIRMVISFDGEKIQLTGVAKIAAQ